MADLPIPGRKNAYQRANKCTSGSSCRNGNYGLYEQERQETYGIGPSDDMRRPELEGVGPPDDVPQKSNPILDVMTGVARRSRGE